MKPVNQPLSSILILIIINLILSTQLNAATQEFKLTASDPSAQAYYGSAVSVSGDYAVVGAYYAYNEDVSQREGAVYVYKFDGTTWQQVARLSPTDVTGTEQFGTSVSISNNRIAVGDSGGWHDGVFGRVGAAYVYDLVGSDWVLTAKLKASDPGPYDRFGNSVSLDGDRLLIAASANYDSVSQQGTGAAYMFEFNGVTWSETQKLTASDVSANAYFGNAVALEGDRAVIGASKASVVDIGTNVGAAYVFELNQNTWTETTILTALNRQENDLFGGALSLSGNQVIINSKEAVQIFEYNINTQTWDLGTRLIPFDHESGDKFGTSVAIDGNKALIGANENDTDVNGSGSAYVYIKNASNQWVLTALVYHTDATPRSGDAFGSAVALDGERAIIGSRTDEVNQVPTFNAGAAYIFDVDLKPVATSDSYDTVEDADWIDLAVLSNDVDFDFGPMYIESITQSNNGTISNESSYLRYKPHPNACNNNNLTDNFTYTLNGGSSVTVFMNVECVDDLPVAVADIISMQEDGAAVTIQVLANDTDVDGGPKSIVAVTQASNGTVINNSSTLSYQPNPNYCNTNGNGNPDSFTYTLNGGSSTTVAMTVNCVDDFPVAVTDLVAINEDSVAIVINVLDNDTDIDAGPKNVTAITQPNHGQVVNNSSHVSYTPNADYCNQGSTTDDFTYTLNGGSVTTVAVEVKCVNDQPSFAIIGDVVAGALILNQSQLQISDFAQNFVFGPANESSQQVLQFNPTIQVDDSAVIGNISMSNDGTLTVDFTQNPGVAIIHLTLRDDGGVANGGNDTSATVVFYVTYSDMIFNNGFEVESSFAVNDFINFVAVKNPDYMAPRYNEFYQHIEFYGHVLELSQGYPSNPNSSHIRQWLNAILNLMYPDSQLNFAD